MAKKTNNKFVQRVRFSPSFNFVFDAVVVLTLVSALGAFCLSFGNPDTEYQTELQKDLFRVFCAGWQSGFGAILGLIGGKITK